MPTLRINKPSKSKPTLRKVGPPASPFQKLIEHRRIERQMSTRELARLVESKSKTKVSQSTVWFWIHAETGYPSPRSFKMAHLRALASVLGLREADVRSALDESRSIYTGAPAPSPRPRVDGLNTLRVTLEGMRGQRVDRKHVLHLVKSLIAQAEQDQSELARQQQKR